MDVFSGSGYAVPMRMWQDSDDTIMVRWYRVPDDTPVFPGVHSFGSLIFDDQKYMGPGPLGEASRRRQLRDGASVTGPGDHFCGDQDWFLTGIPPDRRDDPVCECVEYHDVGVTIEDTHGNGAICNVIQFSYTGPGDVLVYPISAGVGRVEVQFPLVETFTLTIYDGVHVGGLVGNANLSLVGLDITNAVPPYSDATMTVRGPSPEGAVALGRTLLPWGHILDGDQSFTWAGGALDLWTQDGDTVFRRAHDSEGSQWGRVFGQRTFSSTAYCCYEIVEQGSGSATAGLYGDYAWYDADPSITLIPRFRIFGGGNLDVLFPVPLAGSPPTTVMQFGQTGLRVSSDGVAQLGTAAAGTNQVCLGVDATDTIGFFGIGGAVQPVVSGSSNGNPALHSLLDGLSALNLVYNNASLGTSPLFGSDTIGGDLTGSVSAPSIANGAVVLTTKVSGILPVANGGTGVSNATQTYAPTLTRGGVCTAASSTAFKYLRVGNVVTVFGQLTMTCSSVAADGVIDISLPVASNFATGDCGGSLNATLSTGGSGAVVTNAVQHRATCSWRASTTGSQVYVVHFTYFVV